MDGLAHQVGWSFTDRECVWSSKKGWNEKYLESHLLCCHGNCCWCNDCFGEAPKLTDRRSSVWYSPVLKHTTKLVGVDCQPKFEVSTITSEYFHFRILFIHISSVFSFSLVHAVLWRNVQFCWIFTIEWSIHTGVPAIKLSCWNVVPREYNWLAGEDDNGSGIDGNYSDWWWWGQWWQPCSQAPASPLTRWVIIETVMGDGDYGDDQRYK